MKRRGILAAARVAVTGIVNRQGRTPAVAPAAIIGAQANLESGETRIFGTVVGRGVVDVVNLDTTAPGSHAITAEARSGNGIQASSNTAVGVYGTSASGTGVIGATRGFGGTGVYGNAFQDNGTAVGGAITNQRSGKNTRAVVGLNLSTGAGGVGVLGVCDGKSGIGMYGQSYGGTAIGAYSETGLGIYSDSRHNIAVYARSWTGGAIYAVGDIYVQGMTTGVDAHGGTGQGVSGVSYADHGVFGYTYAPGFGGIFGIADVPGSAGVYGSTYNDGANVDTAYAGYFDGNHVVVHGLKSAAVPHPDGRYRLLYCIESPESWFEDFGKGTLHNGRAEIRLDPDFAAVVDADDYHVFLTEYGASSGLFVTEQRATGFVVQTEQAGSSSTFSYRVVARRRDINAERMATFDLPLAAQRNVAMPQKRPRPEPMQRPTLPDLPELPPDRAGEPVTPPRQRG
jgi:hypothetical protein